MNSNFKWYERTAFRHRNRTLQVNIEEILI